MAQRRNPESSGDLSWRYRCVRRLESQGNAGSYMERFRKVTIYWTSYNGLDIQLKVNIRGRSDTPTLSKERVPTRDVLSNILRMTTPRGRVAVAMMAFSALRPESWETTEEPTVCV